MEEDAEEEKRVKITATVEQRPEGEVVQSWAANDLDQQVPAQEEKMELLNLGGTPQNQLKK